MKWATHSAVASYWYQIFRQPPELTYFDYANLKCNLFGEYNNDLKEQVTQDILQWGLENCYDSINIVQMNWSDSIMSIRSWKI